MSPGARAVVSSWKLITSNPSLLMLVDELRSERQSGQPLIEEMFADYRPVDGVQIAYAANVRVAGKPTLERHVDEITINPRPDPGLFKRPAN